MSEHQANTLQELLDIASKHDAIVVDFYATWCGPCVHIGPYVQKKAHQEKVTLVKVNVDVNTDASAKYGINSMPTFQVLDRKGNKVFEKIGGSEAVVNEVIAKAKSHK